MPASGHGSGLYSGLFGDADFARLFSDSAEIRAMLLVEGALAMAQARCGLIPEVSAKAIDRASREVLIDPESLAADTGRNAVVVPGLVAAFRTEMNAPEHAQYVHWGATSQDIMDTALVLRLRQVLALCETRLRAGLDLLAGLARQHADLPMAGRTYGQLATPTSFGAVIAQWGNPLVRHLERLDQIRPRLLRVSLSGAAGTLSAMGDEGPNVRRELANILDLADPGESWHSNRDGLAEFSGWLGLVTASLGKIGEDLILLTQGGIGEVRLAGAGGSSTMPQKQNPVLPSLMSALARHVAALNSAMQAAQVHRQQRDAASWMSEWLALPQMCIATGKSLSALVDVAESVAPDGEAMSALLKSGGGTIHAEALSFSLARHMPRPQAQAAVKELCQLVPESGRTLIQLAAEKWPDAVDPRDFEEARQTGNARDEAIAFAERVAALG